MTWDPVDPPSALHSRVKNLIINKLNPKLSTTLLKLGGIHLFMGPLTLLVCPQFGISPLKNMGLTYFYEKMGEVSCTIACGITYVTFSIALAALLFTPEELKLLKKSKPGLTALMSSLSLGFFVFMGAEVYATLTLWWLLGVLLGSLLTLELFLVTQNKTRLT